MKSKQFTFMLTTAFGLVFFSEQGDEGAEENHILRSSKGKQNEAGKHNNGKLLPESTLFYTLALTALQSGPRRRTERTFR